MEAAPDLKKSVESSILATLVRMLCQTACEETMSSAGDISLVGKLPFLQAVAVTGGLPSSVQRRFFPPR